MTLSNSSALETIESSQASILYQATLTRIDGAQIQQLPATVSITLVAEGTPLNTIIISGNNNYIKRFNFDMYVTNDCDFSEEGVDFNIGPVMVTFGPCDPCTSVHLQWEAQLCVKDDDDLEFEHGLIVDLASTDPSGITAGDPLQITITDDGKFLYQNTRPLFSSLFSQSNLQLV